MSANFLDFWNKWYYYIFQRSNLQESKAISKDKQERIVLAQEAEQVRMQYIDR